MDSLTLGWELWSGFTNHGHQEHSPAHRLEKKVDLTFGIHAAKHIPLLLRPGAYSHIQSSFD